jgi:hypothetical protein
MLVRPTWNRKEGTRPLVKKRRKSIVGEEEGARASSLLSDFACLRSRRPGLLRHARPGQGCDHERDGEDEVGGRGSE